MENNQTTPTTSDEQQTPHTPDQHLQGNAIKDPDDWTTGTEPMTGAQRSYLHTLATEAGEELDENLSKASASKKIDELQHKTGRGLQDSEKSTEK